MKLIEVDIEDGGRRGAAAYFLDHRFQALAEIDAVGQSAKRVMHGEMAQARFAGRNGRRRPTHVAKHEGGKQREADGRDRDEWHNVLHGTRPFRCPGETADDIAARIVDIEGEIADRRRLLIELAQICQMQLCCDARQRSVVDEFYRHEDWRNTGDRCGDTVARSNRDRRDHRWPVHQTADHGSLPVSGGFIWLRRIAPRGC
ncbi:MAG: hypothetical protein WAL36_21045 [Pseudolabrys sp.]